jgi:hypothetical protein
MAYGLTRLVLGANAVVPLTDQEYQDLSAAKAHVLDALLIEQKFDLVIENDLELEEELLSSTARYMLHGETGYGWFQNERALINRRLMNLLSVCREYVDHPNRAISQE